MKCHRVNRGSVASVVRVCATVPRVFERAWTARPSSASLWLLPLTSQYSGGHSTMTSCAPQTSEEKRRRRKWRGRRWSNTLCDHSIHAHGFHVTSGSSVMCSAPYNLYSVCTLPLKHITVLWSSNQENCAPLAACLVVHRHTSELILLHQTALRSSCLEVMFWLPWLLTDPSQPSSWERRCTLDYV